jgi:L-cysteine:1D-myo-inositol 2-amino-2-deoxy-alpha-D-glucopyranoside ligase
MHDSATGTLVDTSDNHTTGNEPATLYVCGITPYDATHIGHAATYIAFDTLHRAWLDAGRTVLYAQNTTDVDDPLLERAAATGEDWRELAAAQTALFRRDMAALRVLPPDNFVAVTEKVPRIAQAVERLVGTGHAYRLGQDWYFDIAAATGATWHLGSESALDRDTMLALSAQRGGDPERIGKRDPLDPLLWRGERPGEPSWQSENLGAGRPGWHIECSVIAADCLGLPLTVQGGGSDLLFPHHEFTAAHTAALDGLPLARVYAHSGMIAYRGEKMSKSLGNLVFVHELLEGGTDPRAIRLAILAHHYREDWEWTDAELSRAEDRLQRWVATAQPTGERLAPDRHGLDARSPDRAVTELRDHIRRDLDTPAALRLLDDTDAADFTDDLVTAVDALLGIRLR